MTTGARSLRANHTGFAALAAAITLLALGIASIAVHRSHSTTSRHRALSQIAAEESSSLQNYFARARSLLQITAHNPAFRQFYELEGSRRARIQARGPVVREANNALAYLERLYPGSIGEACFIDRGGAENARAVKGEIAPISQLSPDETENPFFAPSFALGPGQVYQARPYVSPDTSEWVISNSMLMPTRDGAKRAIVHFEVTVESFRREAAALAARFEQADINVVDARTGRVLIDSRHRQPDGRNSPLGNPSDRHFAPLIQRLGKSGELEVSGKPVTYQRLPRKGQNANDWIVVAMSRAPTPSLLGSVGGPQIAILLASLVLFAFAITTLRSTHRELTEAALTDSLTGLANRRKLVGDLHRGLRDASPERPLLLLLFDLDGFKAYNDSFGHPAGDALLKRLGRSVAREVRELGTAYRMGGDEFCVLASIRPDAADRVTLAAAAALGEKGEGFSIEASYGAVLVPTEAADPSEALRLADQRMYAQKTSTRPSAARQSTDVLRRLLLERNTDLAAHLGGVEELCKLTGEKLGVSKERMYSLLVAASLHDVGKLAIPDAILEKRDQLDTDELGFVRRHTLIGERILGAAPALLQASKLVRWSHERFDGQGYPDGLAGEEIPLEARIIGVCDAYEAMTSGRPYRSRMDAKGAVAELRRCSGTQFDPTVVEAFCAVIEERKPALV